MSAVVIRLASAADRPAILAMLQQASLPTDDLAESGPIQLWVATLDGQPVGAVGLERLGDTGYLRSLVVAPEARKHGTGAALVHALECEAEASGVPRIVLLTQTAQGFFERLGYSVIARERAPDAVKDHPQFKSLCPASAACMLKELSPSKQVLFLCTGNSCRSILGEATFNHLAPRGWNAMSAGSKPTGKVHARSLALLEREGISTAGCYSKSWDNLPATPDIVITVCGSAASETCPAYLGPVLHTHWGVEDPAHATGSEAEIEAAFETAYRTLRRRIEAFLALPLGELEKDRARFKVEMDRIGTGVV